MAVVVHGVSSNGVTFTVPPTLVSIAVSPQNSSLPVGLGEQFTATGTYSDNSTQDLTAACNWSSLNTSIATVSAGWAASHAAGNTTLSATLGTVGGSSVLTVTSPALARIAITPVNPVLPPGFNQQLTATGTYSDGSTQNLTASVTWTSSNTAVATVATGGLVTAAAGGTANIIASTSAQAAQTGITVTSGGPPIIAASASPAPNSAGWNNTNVTVTFTCTPGSAPITFCPSPQTVTSEGANQSVSGTVTDSSGNNATASVTLNIDKTPPSLTLDTPSDGAILTSSTVTASGSLSDALSGVSSLTCNGTSVSPGSGYSCNVSLNPGLNLIAVQATDAAGNIALAKIHVTLNAPLPPPNSIQITPAGANLSVGDYLQFTALDDQGRPRTDATWTVSNTNLATITTDSSPWLTAVASGTVTLTATAQSVSAQAQINILTGTPSPGTVSWSVGPLPGLPSSGSAIFQANPLPIAGTPDVFDIDPNSQGEDGAIQALTVGGQRLWSFTLNGFDVFGSDGFGGILVASNTGGSNGGGLADLDSQTGSQVWLNPTAYPATSLSIGGSSSQFAVRPADGAIFTIEAGDPGPLPHYWVDAFDGSTGQEILNAPLLQSYDDRIEECGSQIETDDGPGPLGPSWVSPVAIDEQGNAYVSFTTTQEYTVDQSQGCSGTYGDLGTDTISLLKVAPDNSSSIETVLSSNWTILGGQESGTRSVSNFVVPDGQGGVLVAWTQAPDPMNSGVNLIGMISHMSANGTATFALPMFFSSSAAIELVVGENGTAFAVGYPNLLQMKIVSFDMNAGSVNWTYTAPQGYTLSMIVSTSGNGLVAKQTTGTGVDTLLRFDSSGNLTTDTWSAVNVENYGGSLWLGKVNNQIAAISAQTAMLSAATWYSPEGNGSKAAVQVESVLPFSMTGTQETTITNVLQTIETALPNNATCSNWLQGSGQNSGISGSQQIQAVLGSGNFGHGLFYLNGSVDYGTAAFSGDKEGDPPGYPVPGLNGNLPVFTVNDVGAFFNQYVNGDQGKPFSVGPRGYAGNTLRTQATTLVHETAHQITVAGFEPDFNNDKAEKANIKAVDKNCRQFIEELQ